MRHIVVIVLFVLFMAILMNYNFKYDAAHPKQSIHRMTYFMTTDEKIQFLKTLDEACQNSICSNLDGLTVDEIKNVSNNH